MLTVHLGGKCVQPSAPSNGILDLIQAQLLSSQSNTKIISAKV